MRNHRTPTIARPRYVWIATTATSHDDGSETAQVLSQHETAEQARDAQLGLTVDGALHVLEHQEPACPV
jgi:hypothetical protein